MYLDGGWLWGCGGVLVGVWVVWGYDGVLVGVVVGNL